MSEQLAHSDYPLPKLTAEVGSSLFADAQEAGIDSVLKLASERLETNNSELSLMVGRYAQGLGLQGREIEVAHGVMVMTHELLRRQAESNSISTQFNASQE